jgi:hypothetical protein
MFDASSTDKVAVEITIPNIPFAARWVVQARYARDRAAAAAVVSSD